MGVVSRLMTVLAFTMLSTSASAAETDPYYAWWSPPSDGTRGINAAVNAELSHAVADINAALGSDAAVAQS
jgi:hypothetical protein